MEEIQGLRSLADLPDAVTARLAADLLGAPWEPEAGGEAIIDAEFVGDGGSASGDVRSMQRKDAVAPFRAGHSGAPPFTTSGRARRLVGIVKGVIRDRPRQFTVITIRLDADRTLQKAAA